jgi:hypothetical protein
MKPKTNPIISQEIYRDLIRNVDLDLGQKDLKLNLTAQHNSILQCLFLDGFRYSNLVNCLGIQYSEVIHHYEAILAELREKFVGSIMNELENQGYDNMVEKAFKKLKKNLEFDLEDSNSPANSIKDFEQALIGKVPKSMLDLSEFFSKFNHSYILYLSLKRMIKAYIILTTSCAKQVTHLFKIEIDPIFDINDVPMDSIDKSFPDDEIGTSHVQSSLLEQMRDVINQRGETFNQDMAKQAKYKEIVANQLMTGVISPNEIEEGMTPEEIVKQIIFKDKE